MNSNNNDIQNLKKILEKLPGVKSVAEIMIKNKIIEQVAIENEPLGHLAIRRLKAEDSAALFDFCLQGLSAKSRIFFDFYPLFRPLPGSVQELSDRIKNWQKEDDWTVLTLVKDKEIIGISLLKRYKTERPVSGLAVRDKFQRMGLGTLLQTIVNEQARLLNLKKFWSGAAQNNIGSLRLHEGCGFKKTGKLIPHFTYENGVKKIDRYDVDLIREFN